MNWLDIAIIIMLCVFAYYGYQQGIIKSVLSVGILILSFLAASIISPLIYGKVIANEELMAGVTSIIEEKLNIKDYLDENISLDDSININPAASEKASGKGQKKKNQDVLSETEIDNILSVLEKELNLPSSVMKTAKKQISQLSPSNVKEQITEQISMIIAEAAAQMIIRGICFTGIYLLLFFILKAASDMLNIISHLPVIHEVNKLAGAALGTVEGLLVIWILGTLLFSLASAFGWEGLGRIMKGSLFMKII